MFLCVIFFQTRADCLEECETVHAFAAAQARQIARHRSRLHRVKAGFFQIGSELLKPLVAVKLAALTQRARPREDGRNGVRRGLLAL